jgi:hypothetical protein
VKKPVLHFFTDLHEDYHRTTDDWQKVNVAGMLKVTDFAATLLRELADRPTPLTFVDQPSPHAQAPVAGQVQTPGYGAYLGTVPDMAGDDGRREARAACARQPGGEGRLASATTSSPAIGDMPITDLQAMTDALRAHKPGDVVPVTVQRDGKPLTVDGDARGPQLMTTVLKPEPIVARASGRVHAREVEREAMLRLAAERHPGGRQPLHVGVHVHAAMATSFVLEAFAGRDYGAHAHRRGTRRLRHRRRHRRPTRTCPTCAPGRTTSRATYGPAPSSSC